MYASLISAGASALYDIYQSATAKGSTSKSTANASASFNPPSADPSSDPSAIGSPSPASATPVNSTGSSGSNVSDAVHKLFVDLQSSKTESSSSTEALTKGLKGTGHHAHHGGKIGDAPGSGPVQNLASSLGAYAKTQGLGASASASLTA